MSRKSKSEEGLEAAPVEMSFSPCNAGKAVTINGSGYVRFMEKLGGISKVKPSVKVENGRHVFRLTPSAEGKNVRKKEPSINGWTLSITGDAALALNTYRGYRYTKISWDKVSTSIGEFKELVLDLDDRPKDSPDDEDRLDKIYSMLKRICEELNVEV